MCTSLRSPLYLGSHIHMGYSGIQLRLNHVLCGLISIASQKAMSSSAHFLVLMYCAFMIMKELRMLRREVARLKAIIRASTNARVLKEYLDELQRLNDENERLLYLNSLLIRDSMRLKLIG